MFEYAIDKDRWSAVLEISFTNNKGKLIQERKVFVNPLEAEPYVLRNLHRYLAFKLRNYINHAYILGLASKGETYNGTLRTDAITFCKDFLKYIGTYNIFAIALWIRQNQVQLERIMPVMNNPSYPSSKRDLDELIKHAKNLKRQTNNTF